MLSGRENGARAPLGSEMTHQLSWVICWCRTAPTEGPQCISSFEIGKCFATYNETSENILPKTCVFENVLPAY